MKVVANILEFIGVAGIFLLCGVCETDSFAVLLLIILVSSVCIFAGLKLDDDYIEGL